MRRLTPLVIVVVLWFLPAMSPSSSALAEIIASGEFDIIVEFGGGLTADQEAVFSQAEAYWESVVTGYQPSTEYLSGVSIIARAIDIDGVGGRLGSARSGGLIQGGDYWFATYGSMTFDKADLPNMESNSSLYYVILHEMAHVLGFGSLWEINGVYTSDSGQYTGTAALVAYQSEFNQPAATYVPVELGGESATANGHWNEVDSGAGLTGIVDSQGRDMKYELMTGWLNLPASSLFISQTTIHSFEDIGFTVVVPEPGGLVMLLGAALTLLVWSRRKRLLAGPLRKAAAASSGG